MRDYAGSWRKGLRPVKRGEQTEALGSAVIGKATKS